MTPIFNDPAAAELFSRRGYVVVPFLSDDEVPAVQELHDRLLPDVPADMYSTVLSDSPEYRQQVLTGIRNLVGDRLKAILPRHAVRYAIFITKRPASRHGRLPLHQDAWFADHTVERAPSVWCPLIDVGPHNACLRVVPGSHQLFVEPSPMNALASNYHAYDPERDPVDNEFITEVPMRAGSALVYDPRLLHGSGENLSDRPRVAFNCITTPQDVAPVVYWWDPRPPAQLKVFEVDEAFLCRFHYAARLEEPYPAGVRYLRSLESSLPEGFRLDRAKLKDLRELARA